MKKPELRLESGPLAGRAFPVTSVGVRLGRSSSNDVAIPDEELSRNHCLFELGADGGVKLTDLASANGTFVNDRPIGGDTVTLKAGDLVTVGASRIRVVDASVPPPPVAPAAGVDLGLDAAASAADVRGASASASAPAARRSPVANILWAVAAAAIVAAAALVFVMPAPNAPATPDGRPSSAPLADDAPRHVCELRYEKVVADAASAFRYYLALAPDGTLSATVDDVPDGNGHVVRSARLSETAWQRLDEILTDPAFLQLDREYVGPDAENPTLSSWTMTVVYAGRVRRVRIVNTSEPDAFRIVREKLEAFSKNELKIWSIQYSREKLLAFAADSAATGRAKWNDRDVEYGNVHAAIRALREAVFYLENVNPRPPDYTTYRSELEEAEKELESRYREQRFRADRALNLSDMEAARRELQIICRLVPDRDDDRNREAMAKLVDVEKRLAQGGRK